MHTKKSLFKFILAGLATVLLVGIASSTYVQMIARQKQNELEYRNNQRIYDLNTIRGFIVPYDTKQKFLRKIPDSDTEICIHQAPDCEGLFDLASLIDQNDMPYDKFVDHHNGTGYAIRKNKLEHPQYGGIQTHTITLTALHAEGEVEIFRTD